MCEGPGEVLVCRLSIVRCIASIKRTWPGGVRSQESGLLYYNMDRKIIGLSECMCRFESTYYSPIRVPAAEEHMDTGALWR